MPLHRGLSRVAARNSVPYIGVLISYVLAGVLSAQPAPFTPPTESFDVKNLLPPLQTAMQQGNFADAAARIDAIVHDAPDALIAGEGGVLQSLRVWTDAMPPAAIAGITAEYDKLNASAAKTLLDEVIVKPAATPEEFLAVATAYPCSSVAAEAIGRAAVRMADYGDASAVTELLTRAAARGWKPSDAQEAVLDAIQKQPLTTGTAIPVGAPWYGISPLAAARRVIPVGAGGIVFTSTERGIVASKESGELLWQFAVGKTDGESAGARASFNRPAVLCDAAGKPQLVIARQIVGGTRFGCLRAFRATDGKPLWSTESNSALGSWSLASAPVIAGRTTVVVGIDDTARPSPVGVLAFETMTGRLLWQTQIGSYANFTDGREPGSLRESDALWRCTGVAIDGSDVFANASTGITVCLDRFDGKIRWAKPYTQALTIGDDLISLGRRIIHNEPNAQEPFARRLAELRRLLGKTPLNFPPDAGERRDGRDVPPEVLLLGQHFSQPARWMSTPAVAGDAVIVAAEDMAGPVALDRKSGVQRWEIASGMDGASLLGAIGNAAIFVDDKLTAIDATSAKPLWTWAPAVTETINGPPVVAGRAVRLPVGRTAVLLSGETGKPDPAIPTGPNLATILGNDASRNALISIDAMSSLSAVSIKSGEKQKK